MVEINLSSNEGILGVKGANTRSRSIAPLTSQSRYPPTMKVSAASRSRTNMSAPRSTIA